MVLLEKLVDGLDAKAVIEDLNDGVRLFAACSKDNGCQLGAVLFELLGLLYVVREIGENELVTALNSRVDDLLQHPNDEIVEIAPRVLASADLFVNFAANFGVSLLLLLNQVEHVELLEVLRGLELVDDLFLDLGGIGRSAVSDKQDSGLDKAAELLEGLVKVLLGVDDSEVRRGLQIRHESLGILIVLADALGENSGGLVGLIGLGEHDHALLAEVLRTLQAEDSGGSNAVFDEELSLELALREVFEEDSGVDLLGEVLDEGHGLGLLITVAQVVLTDEAIVVHLLHVGALAQSLAELGLAGCFRSNDA